MSGSLVSTSFSAAAAFGPRLAFVGVGGKALSHVTLHRGGVDVVGVAVANPGSSRSIEWRLPTGTQLHSLTVYDAQSGQPLTPWGCTNTNSVTTCHDESSVETPPGAEIAEAVLVNANTAPTLAHAAPSSIRASLSEGATWTSIPATFTSSNVPMVVVGRHLSPSVANGGTGVVAYQVHVMRARVGGSAMTAPVTIDHVVPPGVVRTWSLVSPGWRCVGSPTGGPTCSYAHSSIAIGATTSPLVVRYVLRHQATVRTRKLSWASRLTVVGPYGLRISRTLTSYVSLRQHLRQSMKVALNMVGGQTVMPGTTRQAQILQAASDGASSGLADTIVVPNGLRLEGTSSDGWTCPTGSGTLTCRHAAPVLTSGPVALDVRLSVAPHAPRGFAIMAVLSRALDGSVQNAALAMIDIGGAPPASARSETHATNVATKPAPQRQPQSESTFAQAVERLSPTAMTAARVATHRLMATTVAFSEVSRSVGSSSGSSLDPLRESVGSAVVPHASLARPSRRAMVATLPTAPIANSTTALVSSPPSSLTLGGVALTNLSGSIDSSGTFSGSATGTLDGVSFTVSVSYVDASDWTFTVQQSQSITLFGQTLTITGTMSDGTFSSGNLSGALSVNLSSTTGGTYDGLSFSGTLTAAASAGSSPAFSGALTLGFNQLDLTASLTYSDASDWTVQLTGTNQLTFALGSSSVGLAVTGSIGEQSGNFVGSISGATTTPFTLVNGVSAKGSVSFAFTSAATSVNVESAPLSFTGVLTLQIGSLTLPVNFNYVDPTSWSASVAGLSPTGSFDLTPTFSVPISSFQGSIAMASGVVNFGISATLTTVVLVPNVVTLSGITVSLSSSCVPDFGPCPPGTNGVYAMVGGSLALSFPTGGTSSVAFVAVYGMTTHGFDLTTQASSDTSVDPNITLVNNVITLTAPTLEISYNDSTYANLTGPIAVANGAGTASGLRVLVTGTLNLSIANTSVSVSIQAAYSNSGLDIVGSTTSFNLGGTGASIDALGYFTQSTTLIIHGSTVVASPDTFVLAGTLTLPTGLASFLQGPSSISIYALYSSPSNFQISAVVNVRIPVPSSQDFQFTLNDVTLSVVMDAGSLHFALTTSGTLAISGSASPSRTQYDVVSASLTYDVTSQTLAISLSVNGASNDPALTDAFGYPGLTLDSLSFSAGVSFGAGLPTPTFGIAATGSLPASVTDDLGIGTGSALQLGFALNVSATNPCIQVAIGNPSGPPVISIGTGALTASYAMFSVAPNGCTIGTTSVAKGFAVAFTGSFLHESVAFSATLGVSPVTFSGAASISGFSISGFALQGSSIAVLITPSSFSLTFHGAIQILSPVNQVNLAGSIDSNGNLRLQGSANLIFNGFTFAAHINAQRLGNVAYVYASGSLNLLGQVVNLSGTFTKDSRGVNANLMGDARFRDDGYDLGVLSFNLRLGTRSLFGFISFPTSQFATLTARGTLNFGSLGSATLNGSFTHSGSQVGVFLLAHVNANIGSVTTVTGELTLGNCSDSSCSTVGNFAASLAGSFTWQGRLYGFSGAAVAPNWGFAVTSRGQINAASPNINVGFLQFRAWFSGDYSIALSSSWPYVSYGASFNAQIQGINGHLHTSCGGHPWRCHTAVVWGNWYYIASVGVSSDSQGNLSATYLGRTYRVNI